MSSNKRNLDSQRSPKAVLGLFPVVKQESPCLWMCVSLKKNPAVHLTQEFPCVLTSVFCVCVPFYDPNASVLLSWSWTFHRGVAWTGWNVIFSTTAINTRWRLWFSESWDNMCSHVQKPTYMLTYLHYIWLVALFADVYLATVDKHLKQTHFVLYNAAVMLV